MYIGRSLCSMAMRTVNMSIVAHVIPVSDTFRNACFDLNWPSPALVIKPQHTKDGDSSFSMKTITILGEYRLVTDTGQTNTTDQSV